MDSRQLKFRFVPGQFAVCRLQPSEPIPHWATAGGLTSVTRTAEELSVVSPLENVPPDYKPDIPWVCLKLEGPFQFSEVGILYSFISPLAESGIPIFTISTYDTDYVLIQETFAEAALAAVQRAGHQLIE